jgi:hypothetical protein
MPWEDIVVNSKILGHISSGVYRSAGGALKELVSNAFDADATQVFITTNWPSFDVFSCRDNGTGMTKQQFQQIMQGGIGDSSKRVDQNDVTPLGRRIIGRLGIGMLGIAQLCHEFKVISHCNNGNRKGEAFEARVRLMDHLREQVDHTTPEQSHEIEVGKFDIQEIAYDPEQKGTAIVTADMRSTIVRKFRERPGKALPSKFSAYLSAVHEQRSVREMGEYWKMVWELCVSCPIPYIDGGPFDWRKVGAAESTKKAWQQKCESLQMLQFEVIVDGLSLRKPNIFPNPPTGYKGRSTTGRLFPISKEEIVYGRPLQVSGYIYLQDGAAIEPMELRGLLIRIRDVAIGTYGTTFLDYPKIEGPRFNWLSSEVYIQEGLEYALNIDRDSFNQTHAHFIALQKAIHDLLPKVFSEASTGQRERSQVKRENELNERRTRLKKIFHDETGNDFEIVEDMKSPLPVTIDTLKRTVVINQQSSLLPKSKSSRELATLIAAAFELAMQADEPQRKQQFYKLLSRLLET